MEFRIKARIGAFLSLAAMLASGQTATVRHTHARGNEPGELQVTATGISFTEAGKGKKHSRIWTYEEIQQLELSPSTIRILTYEDQKWVLGRDREYEFTALPPGFADTVYGVWRDRLDQRFIADLPDKQVRVEWQIPVKLLGTIQGSQGVIRVGEDRIVYETDKPGQSRTWRLEDIDNMASSGPFDLSVVTREHSGAFNSGSREFRFQLKQPLTEARYNDLWRRLNLSKQSEFVRTSSKTEEQHHE
jgi:hypothetical protein